MFTFIIFTTNETMYEDFDDDIVVKVAVELVAVALATGIVDMFEETIDDTQRAKYRTIVSIYLSFMRLCRSKLKLR